MKITVTYLVDGATVEQATLQPKTIIHRLRGALETGRNAANYQLEAEGKRLRIHLDKIEGGSDAAE